MEISHIELKYIFDKRFSENLKECITTFVKDVEENGKEYSANVLWIQDQKIGGIGGYSMPSNPVKNPFPAGVERQLYRPLQYARSDIEVCDVRNHARYVVQMCGMHVESVCRLYLQNKTKLGQFRFYNTTLGKAVHKMNDIGIISPEIADILYRFVQVYNRSKHEINQDESRERLFNAFDAVIAYFIARILGVTLLKNLGVSESFDFYEILE